MAESSYIWDNNATGDASPHSEAQTAAFFGAAYVERSANAGVVGGMLSELRPSAIAGNTQVRIEPGWGISDGHPYKNDANRDFTPASTGGAGTTGRRIVLRAGWSGQTVRLVEISSTAGTAAIPPLTQTAGTTYDKPICSYTVDNAGAIAAFTDNREFCGSSEPLTGFRTQARRGRRLVALLSGTASPEAEGAIVGAIGVAVYGSITPPYPTHVNGEPVTRQTLSGISTCGVGAWNCTPVIAPNKNPRMLIRVTPPASPSGALTRWIAGFTSGVPTSTTDGAYLRVVTTGNLFFVTRQGGAETAFDLGARPTAPTSYEIETEDLGVTWVLRNGLTGAVLATHTSNVPTAGTALSYFAGFTLSGAVAHQQDIAYLQVEGTF